MCVLAGAAFDNACVGVVGVFGIDISPASLDRIYGWNDAAVGEGELALLALYNMPE